VPAQQLHAQADTQEGLLQGGQQLVEALGAQLPHSGGGFPLTGKQQLVGAANHVVVGRERGLHP